MLVKALIHIGTGGVEMEGMLELLDLLTSAEDRFYDTRFDIELVGGNDHDAIALNRQAWLELQCLSDLVIVPGAGHLFEETGALEEVARLATDWFAAHFAQR